ncbi:MAG: GNAT family N-acetyltransferase [Lachnospiraceae bacterium]|nr:GNAT family N-acetyltransferase [Lachnospiraceae bacterium]
MTIKDGKDYISQVRELIIEYTKHLDRDLSFQNINEELENPAIKYTAPEGELLVAVDETDDVVGMVAYHRHNAERCEMKRLYVKSETRGLHLGEKLVSEIIKHARQAGYKEMVLDTIIPLKAAIGLYRKNGFKECEPYYDNPMDDVIYMIKKL